MKSDRKFSDAEVARIFERATDDDAPEAQVAAPSPAADGLSLAQIKDIAVEAGIDPVRVERAALALARGEAPAAKPRTWMGLPIGVSRTVELGRVVSDDEWDQLVVRLRETFDARGRLQSHGAFRQWTNGNLQALLEPTPDGHRLRLSTRKGNAKVRLGVGLGGLAIGVVIVAGALSAPAGQPDIGALLAGVVAAVAGATTLGATWLRLPKWARTRAAQMETIAQGIVGQRHQDPSLPR
jgi:hypothetical protein